jgi:hypothetical protein
MNDDVKNEYKRCISCGNKDAHNILCDLIDVEQAKLEIKNLYDKYHDRDRLYLEKGYKDSLVNIRLKKEISFWQGKYHTVKNENNKLRKKLL